MLPAVRGNSLITTVRERELAGLLYITSQQFTMCFQSKVLEKFDAIKILNVHPYRTTVKS